MGRHLPNKLSEAGVRIRDRMVELGLDPAAVAAAAGLSPSTLYRIMRKDRKATVEPRLQTKRRIARALKTTIVWLFNEPQLELVEQPSGNCSNSDPFERLLVHQFRRMREDVRTNAGREAAYTLINLIFALRDPVAHSSDGIVASSDDAGEDLLVSLLRRLPASLRRYGAKSAIRAMLEVEALHTGEASEPMYRAATRTNWSTQRILRDRPPLTGR